MESYYILAILHSILPKSWIFNMHLHTLRAASLKNVQYLQVWWLAGYEFPCFTRNKNALTSIIAYTGLVKNLGIYIYVGITQQMWFVAKDEVDIPNLYSYYNLVFGHLCMNDVFKQSLLKKWGMLDDMFTTAAKVVFVGNCWFSILG